MRSRGGLLFAKCLIISVYYEFLQGPFVMWFIIPVCCVFLKFQFAMRSCNFFVWNVFLQFLYVFCNFRFLCPLAIYVIYLLYDLTIHVAIHFIIPVSYMSSYNSHVMFSICCAFLEFQFAIRSCNFSLLCVLTIPVCYIYAFLQFQFANAFLLFLFAMCFIVPAYNVFLQF